MDDASDRRSRSARVHVQNKPHSAQQYPDEQHQDAPTRDDTAGDAAAPRARKCDEIPVSHRFLLPNR